MNPHRTPNPAPAKPWLLQLAVWFWVIGTTASAAFTTGSLTADTRAEPLRIGSKRFTESYILAQVIAQQAAPHLAHAPVVLQGLGNTAIVYEALRSGAIDVYPEYAGTISLEILKSTQAMSLTQMRHALAPLGLGADVPLGFNNGYALAMQEAHAQGLGVRTLSDLAHHPALKLGLSNEFLGRSDGWLGLAKAYGLAQTPIGLDHGLAYDAIKAQQIDVIDIYSTDPKIAHLGLRVLTDDRSYFPRYDALLLYRLDLPTRFPAAWGALQKLEGRMDERAMIAMNARAELQGVAFDVIARDHLADQGEKPVASPTQPNAAQTPAPQRRGFWGKLFGPDLARLTGQHLALVLGSVSLAALLAIPLAVWTFPHPRLRAALLGLAGLMQTVPSLALLAALIALLGAIGSVPALLALTLYALLPIMRNTSTGLAEVPKGLRLAAQALGLTGAQCLRYIELPLALPTLLAGVRTATSIAIGTATIAAFIGAGGFGERIVTGLALNDSDLLLAGAIPAAVMALLSEALFEALTRSLGIKR